MWDLVGNPKDRFSHNEAQFILQHETTCIMGDVITDTAEQEARLEETRFDINQNVQL